MTSPPHPASEPDGGASGTAAEAPASDGAVSGAQAKPTPRAKSPRPTQARARATGATPRKTGTTSRRPRAESASGRTPVVRKPQAAADQQPHESHTETPSPKPRAPRKPRSATATQAGASASKPRAPRKKAPPAGASKPRTPRTKAASHRQIETDEAIERLSTTGDEPVEPPAPVEGGNSTGETVDAIGEGDPTEPALSALEAAVAELGPPPPVPLTTAASPAEEPDDAPESPSAAVDPEHAGVAESADDTGDGSAADRVPGPVIDSEATQSPEPSADVEAEYPSDAEPTAGPAPDSGAEAVTEPSADPAADAEAVTGAVVDADPEPDVVVMTDIPVEPEPEPDTDVETVAEAATDPEVDSENVAEHEIESADEAEIEPVEEGPLELSAIPEPESEPEHQSGGDSSTDDGEATDAAETDDAGAASGALFEELVISPLPDPDEAAVALRGVTRQFGDTRAVDGIDLTIPVGSFYGIVGPNGAGKTTTLSMIAGLQRPDAGQITIGGVDTVKGRRKTKRMLGILPDRLRTFDRLTGHQLLYYYGVLRGLRAREVEKRVGDLARAFDITAALSRPVSDYSAGMTKKIMLAGAMIHAPRVLVLDEPFESVDPVSSEVILDILTAYVDNGGTVVLSSHGMSLIERACTHVAVIVGGQVLAEGTVDEVRGEDSLETRFGELTGGVGDVEGLEWLHTFSA